MDKKLFSDRLNQAMSDRGYRNIDVVTACNKLGEFTFTRADIAKYCSGKSIPTYERLVVLGKALGVTERWLLGYDVDESITAEESRLIQAWRIASDDQKENVAFILRNCGMSLERSTASKAG